MATVRKRTESARVTGPASDAKAPVQVFLVSGDDEGRVTDQARKIIATLLPESDRMLGLEEVDGVAENSERAVAALRECLVSVSTVSFMGGVKVCWFRDVRFLKNAKISGAAVVQEWMAKLVASIKNGLTERHYLIVSAPGVDGRSAFYKACQARGMTVAFDRPEREFEQDDYAREIIGKLLTELNLTADAGAVESLVQRVGADTRGLRSEVEKLSAYMGARRRMTETDVSEVVTLSREGAGYELADYAGARDTVRALRTLRRLLQQKEEPLGLIAGIEKRWRDLAILRDARQRGWVGLNGANAAWNIGEEAERALGQLGEWNPRKINPYRAGRLLEQAERFSENELARGASEILRVREQMVSGFSAPELLLELLLLKIAAPAPVRARGGRM